MKFGIAPINKGVRSADAMIEYAQLAEAAGVESVWTFEHVMIPLEYDSRYPYSRDGRMSAEPETNYIDPFVALAAIARETKMLRLATGVNILPQANPLLMAKQAASLDFISGGRFMLGVGIGWMREEFAAMDTPFEARGARFDDYLQAMRAVWSGEVVEHDGEFVQWHGFKSFPLPVQSPFPVHIGGNKGKAFDRIAKYGNGWFAPTGKAEKLAVELEALKAACAACGRDFGEIEISAMWPMNGGLDAVKAFEDLGVHRLNVPLLAMGSDDPAALIRQLGDEVIAKI